MTLEQIRQRLQDIRKAATEDKTGGDWNPGVAEGLRLALNYLELHDPWTHVQHGLPPLADEGESTDLVDILIVHEGMRGVDVGYWTGKDWYYEEGDSPLQGTVIAWQPRPEVPEWAKKDAKS